VIPRARSAPDPGGRRLALTPISLDVVAALAHDPDGMRLTPLAHAIGSPVSSVQAALRILLANDLIARDADQPPRYRLAAHPAAEALVEFAVLLPEPAHVLGVVLRASPAVLYAAADRAGFVVAVEPGSGPARDRLDRTLAIVRDARSDVPPVEQSELPELARIVAVSVGLRSRLDSAVTLKGRLPSRRGTTAWPTAGSTSGASRGQGASSVRRS
jgi:hypothetical protein